MTIVATSVTRLLADVAEGERESCTLAALRDSLLAKLISGDLRVPDVEGIVGRAG